MHRRYKLIFMPLGYGELLAKNNEPKLAEGWARGSLLISATIEDSNFKFCTQVGFGK